MPVAIAVSAAVVTSPRHKQTPRTVRERVKRAKQYAQHRKHKQGRKTKPLRAVSQRYAQTWGDVAILFRTHGDKDIRQHTRCVR